MEDAQGLLTRIRDCIVSERFKDAVRYAEEYLRPATRDVLPPELHLAVAAACENIGDFARAQSYYRIYARYWPEERDTPAALFASARIAAEHLNDYDGALRHLMVIIRKFPHWGGMENATQLIASIQATLSRVSAVEDDDASDTGARLIIRQTSDQLPLAQVAKLVAFFTKAGVLDVTRRLRKMGWIIAWDLGRQPAMALAGELQKMGVPVLVLPASKMVTLPPVEKIRLCSPLASSLQLATKIVPKPEFINLPWNEVQMVVAGFIRRSVYQPTAGASDPFAGFRTFGYRGARLRGVDMTPAVRPEKVEQLQVIDVIPASGETRYRAFDNDTLVKYRERTRRDFAALARMLLIGSGGKARANEAAYLLAGRQKISGWREFVFSDFNQFDTYVFWQLNLHKFS